MQPIIDSTPAAGPQRITIQGRYATLVPLDPAAHGQALWEGSSGGESASLWDYLFGGPFDDRAAFDAHLRERAAGDDPLFFAILDRGSGRPVGWASYMRIEPRHRVIEVGNILYTGAATDCRGPRKRCT